MKPSLPITLSLVVALFIVNPARLHAGDAAPKYTVEEIMKAVFKGEDSIGKRVGKGNGTQADFDKLAEYLSSLPLNDAPQGDPDGWKQKTTAVLSAAVALKDGKPGALAQFNTTVNCQACHRIYRPD